MLSSIILLDAVRVNLSNASTLLKIRVQSSKKGYPDNMWDEVLVKNVSPFSCISLLKKQTDLDLHCL